MTTSDVIEMMYDELGTEVNTIEIDDFEIIDQFAANKGYEYDKENDIYIKSNIK